MKNCIIHSRLTLYYTIYMILLMQYFIFYKSHGSNVFNFPILFVLAGPGKETTTVYATKLISPETRFLDIFFPTTTNLIHGLQFGNMEML